MTTHHRRPATTALAAALGLALGVLLAGRRRRPRHPAPVPLHLVRRDPFEAGLLRDLATQRPPAQQLAGGARPIPRGR